MIYKGFYEDFFTLKKDMLKEYFENDITFDFLENTCDAFYQDDLSIINLEKYLHGFCDEFALMLNFVYHYPIEVIFFCGRIIHAYCKIDNLFIDVRGITDDKKLFFSEFEDELQKETHRVLYKTTKECFNELCDWCGLNYHILNKKELELLSKDKWLDNYYKI